MSAAYYSRVTDSRSREILTLQYLRGVAALLVVFHHAFTAKAASRFSWLAIGEIGVDIFFVISGIVMWTTTAKKVPALARFFRNRLTRIFPLWWLALTAWIVLRMIHPDRLGGADITIRTLWSSYLLVPHFHEVFHARVWPILVPGWTLQFELFFYLLFGLCLILKDSGARLLVLTGGISTLAIIGIFHRFDSALLQVVTSPLLLEFLAGIWIAVLLPRVLGAGRLLGFLAVLAGLAAYVAVFTFGSSPGFRVLAYGVPAVMIVLGFVALEPSARSRENRLLHLLGDGSYSIYLFHGLFIAVVSGLWGRFVSPADPSDGLLFVPAAFVISIGGSLLIYKLVEWPMLQFFKGRIPKVSPAGLVPDEPTGRIRKNAAAQNLRR